MLNAATLDGLCDCMIQISARFKSHLSTDASIFILTIPDIVNFDRTHTTFDIMDNWLRTDEYGEVKQTLRACIDFAQKIPTDIAYSKWLILAMHNLVQGFMVIALTRSDGFGAMRREDCEASDGIGKVGSLSY
jgi:hypothetical protein